jgi:hypothetical protein
MKRSLALALLLSACTPDFDDAPWRVDEPRVLAIASTPAEARPGEPIVLTALVADPDGPRTTAPAWSVCTRPRTSAERTAVTEACLQGDALQPVASSATVLADACARFGPNTPPTEGDAPPQRPADPDPSGGYFLPVAAVLEDEATFGAVRIRCDLPGVTRAIFDAYEDRYTLNEAPTGVQFDVPTNIAPGDDVALRVQLPASSSEPYVRYDAGPGVLVDEREWLRVQWFVTDGELDRGQDVLTPSGNAPLETEARWHAPEAPGPVHAWAAVTDARGGVTWTEAILDVR